MIDPKDCYKLQSIIPDKPIMKLSGEFKNSFGSIGDLIEHKTRPNLTAAEHALREQQFIEQWRKEELSKRYAVSQQKLLTSIKAVLKDFEGYQLLLQSDSYRQLQELVQAIETVPVIPPENTPASSAYITALRYGLVRRKSP